MTFKGCWSCGAHGPCYSDCQCAKCVDPIGYARWRRDNPKDYADWLQEQHLGHGEYCDCPSCRWR